MGWCKSPIEGEKACPRCPNPKVTAGCAMGEDGIPRARPADGASAGRGEESADEGERAPLLPERGGDTREGELGGGWFSPRARATPGTTRRALQPWRPDAPARALRERCACRPPSSRGPGQASPPGKWRGSARGHLAPRRPRRHGSASSREGHSDEVGPVGEVGGLTRRARDHRRGPVRVALRHPWRDGTTRLEF